MLKIIKYFFGNILRSKLFYIGILVGLFICLFSFYLPDTKDSPIEKIIILSVFTVAICGMIKSFTIYKETKE